ncbi:hypothetical protein A3A38_00195 [Candidatus Kaiserbacteria bacterium RIFCSPLOWO2_01_FULL_53_17]|uniref:HD domain-containing protein n=1 Tax=Candidatus Kaiserbacteria bacterium RIFCSPLOWO2_01_FULL_53_17 TaxID=1798511 RepID=A0A1F6EG66_9BACT|nr:MAG: hypothetical protein A3A38_00195 [Candidatus Kaiserbacteria bacterium RIFCSPLOWO2_01_FULL_53_17]
MYNGKCIQSGHDQRASKDTGRRKTENCIFRGLRPLAYGRDAHAQARQGPWPESEGWRNIAEHCLLAGVTAYTLGRLARLEEADLQELTFAALTHDWDKRLQKEQVQLPGARTPDGLVMTGSDSKALDEMERGKRGIERVTGHDLRDFDTWNMKEKIMRYVDSCLGTKPDGRAYLQDWHERFAALRKRSPQMNINVGNELYGGTPLFDTQEEITGIIEKELFEIVKEHNPELSQKFLTPSDLRMLVEGAILADVSNTIDERPDAALENQGSIARLLGAVVSAGSSIKELERTFEVKEGQSHRSGITSGDVRAQEILFENIRHAFPEACILSEEGGMGGGNVLNINNPEGILEMPAVVVMDPIDGTAVYTNKSGTWSVGAGFMRSGEFVGSAFHAPGLNGGMTVTAEKGKGVYIAEWGAKKPERIEPLRESTARKNAVVAMGVDATLHQPLMSAVPPIASQIRAWTLANSGLLALAQVATGRLQAVVQTPQKPWDWAPMYRAVLESGRVFKFFRLVPDTDANDGTSRLVPVAEYDERSFSVASRENRLGFVAGEPEIAEWLFGQLPKNGWSVRRPDATA